MLRDIPYTSIFDDNGYEYDEESRKRVKRKRTELDAFIRGIITPYIANMYCKSVEAMNTFRNHNRRISEKLNELGCHEFAQKVDVQREKELNNIEEIRSRQMLRSDYKKYMQESKIDRYTAYMSIC